MNKPENLKVLIAPDSFKDCLSSEDVARFIGEGIKAKDPGASITPFPVADGGEGTASCIAFHQGGEWRELVVNDPLHRPVKSRYLVIRNENTAVIELAVASGLELLKPEERNALKTSTLGTGELIRDALDKGIKRIILTIGGSATVDGGTGIAHALGFRFYDENNNELVPSGQVTGAVRKIDKRGIHRDLDSVEFIIACDVQNILNGEEGAARVYGPQKGADHVAVNILEAGLLELSGLVMTDSGFNADDHPGTGAAGGASLFLLAYGNAVLKPGFEIVSELTGFKDALDEADLVISGEGKIDQQTSYGKLVSSVAGHTAERKKDFIAVAGTIEGDREKIKQKLSARELYSVYDLAENRDDSFGNAAKYLKQIGSLIAGKYIGL